MSARGRRPLSAEDRALWAEITRSVAPLRAPPAVPAASPRKPQAKALARADAIARGAAAAKPPPALEPLDRRQRQRLARGSTAIDDRIDLHGKTQREAHSALVRFLKRAQRDGARFVLVITGKGVRESADGGRGVLRRQVPEWLRLPEMRAYVVGFEAAHAGHGGEGALYVRIRRSVVRGQ